MVGVAQERLNDILRRLSDKDKEQVMEFAEFIYQKRKTAWKEALKNVPEENEKLSPGEIEALKDGEQDIKAGRVRPLHEVLQELQI